MITLNPDKVRMKKNERRAAGVYIGMGSKAPSNHATTRCHALTLGPPCAHAEVTGVHGPRPS
jgi:hypothetical protein